MLITTLAAALAKRPPQTSRQAILIQQFHQLILDGRLRSGDRLPATRQLAEGLKISRNTALRVYDTLIAEGFFEADRAGTRVATLPAQAASAPSLAPPPGLLARRARDLPLRHLDPLLPFAPGVPDLNLFPWSAWRRHLQQAWREVGVRQLVLAPPGGEPRLRQTIAKILRLRRGLDCQAEQVFVVAGGHVALDACARLLADAGERVWIEDPGYPTARNSFLAADLKLEAIPTDAQGMQIDTTRWQTKPPRLVYLTPAHQYPLGSVLSLERRLSLLHLAEAGKHWLIEDDYDSEFSYGRNPPPAMQSLMPDAPVVYIGTFSQLLYPGLRIAYLVLPPWAAKAFGERLEALYRGGQAVEQKALAAFLEHGQLLRHLKRMTPRYAERQHCLRAALSAHFGSTFPITGGEAGLHLCLHLPADCDDHELAAETLRRGIIVRPLSEYAMTQANGVRGLVFGYGMASTERIPELVQRLPRPT